jgi:hypothetical protein
MIRLRGLSYENLVLALVYGCQLPKKDFSWVLQFSGKLGDSQIELLVPYSKNAAHPPDQIK